MSSDGSSIPRDAEVVTTFSEYSKVVKTFFAEHYGLLILVGRPGLSKSFEFEKQIEKRDDAYLLRGMASPFKLYVQLHDHANEFIVLDDAEVVWGEKAGRVILRSLCEMKKPTTVSWEKANKWLESNGYPNSFPTSSKVCLICNKFHFGKSEEFAAIADRGHLIYFDPSSQEVHKYAGKWFPQKGKNAEQVYKYIGSILDYLPDLSFRVYEKSLQNLNAGRDWKAILEQIYMADADMRLVAELEANKSLTGAQRLEIFAKKAKTGSRGVYYKYRQIMLRHQKDKQQDDDEGMGGVLAPKK